MIFGLSLSSNFALSRTATASAFSETRFASLLKDLGIAADRHPRMNSALGSPALGSRALGSRDFSSRFRMLRMLKLCTVQGPPYFFSTASTVMTIYNNIVRQMARAWPLFLNLIPGKGGCHWIVSAVIHASRVGTYSVCHFYSSQGLL